MSGRCLPATRRGPARGMTLIIAMVMLVVIGLASVAMMRNALGSDQGATGTRSQAQALQYAQAALRWCEMRWQAGAATPAVLPAASTPHWSDPAAWRGPGAAAQALSAADLGSGAGSRFPAVAPRCLAEERALTDGTAIVTTARGQSLDYSEDARGHVLSGSAVWVQSISLPAAPAASGGDRPARTRAWRQLLTPPAS